MILGLETSSVICSVALYDNGGNVLQHFKSTEKNKHAEELPQMAEKAMRFVTDKGSLDAVAVSKGPGSYTGLRIGTSLAKGLCYSLNIPLISVNALRGMAQYSLEKYTGAEIAISMLDARRDDVYMEVFDRDLHVLEIVSAVTLLEHTLEKYHNQKVVICGNSNEKWTRIVRGFESIFQADLEPDAAYNARESAEKLQAQHTENVAYFEPFYLKDFIPGVSRKTVS